MTKLYIQNHNTTKRQNKTVLIREENNLLNNVLKAGDCTFRGNAYES